MASPRDPMAPAAEDVSSAIIADMLAATERMGWPVRPDWAALGLDEARLRSRRGWVSWEVYLRVLHAYASPEPGPTSFEALGRVLIENAMTSSIRHFGALVDGSVALYHLTYARILQSLYRVVRSEIDDTDPARLVVRLRVDPGCTDPLAFFRVTHGTMGRLPTLLGAPEARVDLTIEGHVATYVVRLVPSNSLMGRLRRAWGVLRGGDGVASATATLMGEVDAAVANLADLQRRLAAAEKRSLALATGIPGLVADVGPDGVVRDVTGAAAIPATLGPGHRWVDAFHPDDRAVVAAQFARAVAGERIAPIEARTVDGRGEVWWACGIGPADGDPPGFLVVAVDVTERHLAREARVASDRKLVEAQKLEAIGRLSSGLVHDLNNVLAVVQAHADLIEARLAVDDDARTGLAGIRAAVGRASALTRRLLHAAARRQVAHPAPTDLGAAVRGTHALFAMGLGEAIRFEVHAPAEPVLVSLDESRLEQILLNLVLNARDAQPAGGVIEVRVGSEGEVAVVTVRDEGTGMTPEVRQRATAPFFTTKPVGLGSGLGLSTVHDIVAAAGGRLGIDSAPGRGTVIRVELPLASAGPFALRPSLPAVGGGESILLAEDDPEVRHTLTDMLNRLGYAVSAHPTAEAALEALDAGVAVDLVVTDAVMPGMGGMGLVAALRARTSPLPVLLVSGMVPAPRSDDPVGPDAFLSKPFRLVELSAAVRGLLDRAERAAG